LSTRTFHLLTGAPPEQIWAALTCPTLSPRFLHGLSAQGCWQAGGALLFTSPHGLALTGQVLFSEPPYKLSWTIEDEASGTCTYLTWDLRTTRDGTVVRLRVDEDHAGPADDEELEDAWLPALAALEAVLQN
jgi:uncharacterized protein YndB with AHSA1/START domain